MLTGDNPKAAEHVANLLGLTEFHAGLLPDDKQKIIADYQAKGNHVIMVGDGVNDAPSLAAADIELQLAPEPMLPLIPLMLCWLNQNPAIFYIFLIWLKSQIGKWFKISGGSRLQYCRNSTRCRCVVIYWNHSRPSRWCCGHGDVDNYRGN